MLDELFFSIIILMLYISVFGIVFFILYIINNMIDTIFKFNIFKYISDKLYQKGLK